MTEQQQLDFFPKSLETQMEDLKIHIDKIRKSLYARESKLRKEFNETIHEVQTLKQAMSLNNVKEMF